MIYALESKNIYVFFFHFDVFAKFYIHVFFRIEPDTAIKLKSTSYNLLEQNGIVPTRLCCRTADAQMINQKELFKLPGKEYKFEAFDTGPNKTLDDLTPVAKTIILKPGAQVMLLKNISISTGLVNGARGVVKSFDKNGLFKELSLIYIFTYFIAFEIINIIHFFCKHPFYHLYCCIK